MKRTSLVASWVFVAALLPLVAHAEEPAAAGAAPPKGSALRSAGDELVQSALGRLGPMLAERAVRSQVVDDGAGEKLATALGAEAIVGLREAFGTPATFVWTTVEGLSPAGERAVAALAEAPLHGVTLGALATGDAAIKAWQEATKVAPAPPRVLSDSEIAAAWNGSAGSGDRLSVATKAVAVVLGPPPAPADPAKPAKRVAAEVAIAEGIAQLVAELPARPRQQAVLVADKGEFYVSPDVVWRSQPAPVSTPEAIKAAFAAAQSGSLEGHLASLLPTHPQYGKLLAAAKKYAAICAGPDEGWAPVKLAFEKPGPKVQGKQPAPVATAETVTAVQKRLAIEGFYAGGANGQLDEATTAALTTYREARQLSDKQLIDEDLGKALDVPCAKRLETLELNLRRWRFTAWNGQPTWVQVNLAGQELRYTRDGELALFRKTVVGSSKSFVSDALKRKIFRNASPVLQDEIVQVIVNPEWNVPARIGREELGPEIEKDPEYMTKHHMRAVEQNGQTWYKQDSGPWNALGQIKILFPNSESVYLHDTPGKNAFKLPVRALSHGCVRVQGVLDLGTAIVRSDFEKAGKTFDEKAFMGAVASQRMAIYNLTTPIPVFFEYYTASVDEAGVVRFHPDVYEYDLDLKVPPIALRPERAVAEQK